jgi:hypothetical protein
MTNPRDRKASPGRPEPQTPQRGRQAPRPPAPARPARPEEAAGPGFIDQLKQRRDQGGRSPARADSDFTDSLEDLGGAEGESLDLMRSRASGPAGRRPAPDDDDDYEPTVLLQSPGLLEQMRGKVREQDAAPGEDLLPEEAAIEEAPAEEAPLQEVSSEEDTPQFWTPDTLEAVQREIAGPGLEEELVSEPDADLEQPTLEQEPSEDVAALTDEFEELLEDEHPFASAVSEPAADAHEEIDEEAVWRAQLEGVEGEEAAGQPGIEEEYAEELAAEEQVYEASVEEEALEEIDEAEERTLVGEEELASPFRFPAPPAPAPPKRFAASVAEKEEVEEPGAVPFEDQLEAALEEPAVEEADLQAAPVGALEPAPEAAQEDLDAVPFEAHLEARLADASTPIEAGADVVAAGSELACSSCGQPVAGVLAQRLLELTEALERLRAEVRELGQRLDR